MPLKNCISNYNSNQTSYIGLLHCTFLNIDTSNEVDVKNMFRIQHRTQHFAFHKPIKPYQNQLTLFNLNSLLSEKPQTTDQPFVTWSTKASLFGELFPRASRNKVELTIDDLTIFCMQVPPPPATSTLHANRN